MWDCNNSEILRNVHRIIKVKKHLHHSHTTGEILGYVHDSCNWWVRENIMHNFFGFDMYFFIRWYSATAWNSKNLNIGGTGLTRINFANINITHKFIDTFKYYQQSLSQLIITATEEEKQVIKKSAVQYIANYDYFGIVWEKPDVSKKFIRKDSIQW